MREPKAAWVRALQNLEGCADATIRWNEQVGRWEFVMRGADHIMRSQFWGDFRKPVDPLTGLHPFRDLDDAAMHEAIANLTKTYVANPYDGAGTVSKEIMRRFRENKAEGRRRYLAAGQEFADRVADRGHRLRGAGWSGAGGSVAAQARTKPTDIVVANVIGGRK